MELIALIEQQSPFVQGLIASAVFAGSALLLRAIYRRVSKSSSRIFGEYQRGLLGKHWLHKYYLNSENPHLLLVGFSIIVLQTFSWIVRGLLIFSFFLGINSLLNGEWLWAACAWFLFNCFLEALQWIKDKSKDEDVAHIDDEIKKQFFESLPEHQKEHAKHLSNGS